MLVTAGYTSRGTGFIFDTTGETGFVVTAHHVIEDENSFDVQVGGREYTGTLLGYNSEEDADLAVLSICCNPDFHALPWERGGTANVGDPVVAIGLPRNVLVSTTGNVVDDAVAAIAGLVGHDAPVQSGSSGGPLLTMDGKILGINVAVSLVRDGFYYAVPYEKVAVQAGEWKSRLVVLESTPSPAPAGDDSGLSISGTGRGDMFLEIPAGRYTVSVTIGTNVRESGRVGSFGLDVEHVADGEEDWFVFETDVSDTTLTYLITVGDGTERAYERDLLGGQQLVKVETAGSWAITFKPVG